MQKQTTMIKPSEINRKWYVIDATDVVLGRLGTLVGSIITGKYKPTYTPNQEMGDYIVIINADKVAVTGNKADGKIYYHHTGYAGGLKSFTFNKKIERHPEDPLKLAIKGMLPNGRLGRKLLKNVKIFAGSENPCAAQNPQPLEV